MVQREGESGLWRGKFREIERIHEMRDNTNSWYLDSGATHHVSPNHQLLQQSLAYQGPDNLQVRNGQGLPISSIGSSIFQINDHHIHLKNILHVPQITKNLLSMLKLTTNNDVFVEFYSSFCLIKDKNIERVLLKGTIR